MKNLLETSFVQRLFGKKYAELVDSVSYKLLRSDGDYKEYVASQIVKSYSKSDRLRFWRLGGRTELIREMNKVLPRNGVLRILCVGCRDTRELKNTAKICGVANVQGIDLFSVDSKIVAGDMHCMPFDKEFDALISCDNLEHAYDPSKALSEFRRVVKDNGLIGIQVPVNYATTNVDRHDYKSIEHLLQLLNLKKEAVAFSALVQGKNSQKLRVIVGNTPA